MIIVKVGLFIGFSIGLDLFYTCYYYQNDGIIRQAFFPRMGALSWLYVVLIYAKL
jgi:hypothetical protein